MKTTTEIPDDEKYKGYDVIIILGDNYNKIGENNEYFRKKG